MGGDATAQFHLNRGSVGPAWLLALGAASAVAVDGAAEPPPIIATDRSVTPDGILEEWGAAKPLHIRHGDGPVGVRGGFGGESDHYVDIYLMWGVDHIYVAVVVEDDRLDIAHIPPAEYVWNGQGGQRKDKMYYFDHLKVFLRAPRANLGYNIWIAPADLGTASTTTTSGRAYAWGSQQRSPGAVDIPVKVGSAASPGVYTYELAIPWDWLQVHPEEGMKFDSMFLLPDSDLPELSLEDKVEQSNKWIWWKGVIELAGTPSGWQPPPESIVDQVEKGVEEFIRSVPQVEKKPAPAPESPDPLQEVSSADRESSDLSEVGPVAAVESEAADGAELIASPYLPDLERLEESLKRRQTTAPALIDEISNAVTAAQARALFRSMAGALQRMNRDRISGRIDVIVTDAAAAADTEKRVAKDFAINLLERMLQDLKVPESALRAGLAEVAGSNSLGEKRVLKFVQRSTRSVQKWYQKNDLYGVRGVAKVPTTRAVLKREAGKSKLSEAEARQVIGACLDFWILQ